MMPLSFLRKGQVGKVTNIVGNDEIKAHLKDLGFVLGADISEYSTISAPRCPVESTTLSAIQHHTFFI